MLVSVAFRRKVRLVDGRAPGSDYVAVVAFASESICRLAIYDSWYPIHPLFMSTYLKLSNSVINEEVMMGFLWLWLDHASNTL